MTEWIKVKNENEERAKPHTLDNLIAQKKEYSLEDRVTMHLQRSGPSKFLGQWR